jgi:hypothetical protein
MTTRRELSKLVAQLTGLPCWNVTAGAGSGSRIALDFGKKLPRSTPVTNPLISESARNYIGEYALFVENCAWRLDTKKHVLCSWRSSNLANDEMLRGLTRLVDAKIRSVHIKGVALDLVLRFENGCTLYLFSDCIDPDEDGDNYSLYSPKMVLSVGGIGQIASEARSTEKLRSR